MIEQLEQILAGKIKVTEIPQSLEVDFHNLLNKKFNDRYKKIVRGFELATHMKHSPTHFWLSFGSYKQIRFSLSLHTESYYDSRKTQPFTKVIITYQDAGVHQGNAYGNQIDEVTRKTSIKHIKELIPKIEEIYSNIEAVANTHREQTIKNRIEKLQSKVSGKLDDLKSELREIKEFQSKYGKFNSALNSSLNHLISVKEKEIIDEEVKLQFLPEFKNPLKVLGLE